MNPLFLFTFGCGNLFLRNLHFWMFCWVPLFEIHPHLPLSNFSPKAWIAVSKPLFSCGIFPSGIKPYSRKLFGKKQKQKNNTTLSCSIWFYSLQQKERQSVYTLKLVQGFPLLLPFAQRMSPTLSLVCYFMCKADHIQHEQYLSPTTLSALQIMFDYLLVKH